MRLLALNDKEPEASSLELTKTLDALARIYSAQAKYAQAEPLYRRSLAIREKVQGRESMELIPSLENLIKLGTAMHKYDAAPRLWR